jgi:hypothetical protein
MDGGGWRLGPTLPLCFHFLFLLDLLLSLMASPLPWFVSFGNRAFV